MTSRRTQKPALRLDPVAVDAWRLERQFLAAAKANAPEEVARTLVGVQAQVLSSAALAVALRSTPGRAAPSVDATARALSDRRVVRSWAMRGTLHLFAAADVPVIAAALGGKDHWRRPAWLRWFGVTEPELDAVMDVVGEVLDDGKPRSRAELAEAVGARMGENAGRLLRGSWGGALKVVSTRYYLCQSAEDGRDVRFVRASRWVDGWREVEQQDALAELVERYLAAYGPATLRELMRWWGVATLVEMRPVIERLGDALTEVDVDGVRAYVRSADLDSIAGARPAPRSVALLGGFDPLIVGGGLRERLIPPAHLKRVSRTAGWISPVVLVDGRVAGVWDSRRTGDRLGITVETFESASRGDRGAIEAAAERVAAAQGLPVTVGYGPVFTERGVTLEIGPRDA